MDSILFIKRFSNCSYLLFFRLILWNQRYTHRLKGATCIKRYMSLVFAPLKADMVRLIKIRLSLSPVPCYQVRSHHRLISALVRVTHVDSVYLINSIARRIITAFIPTYKRKISLAIQSAHPNLKNVLFYLEYRRSFVRIENSDVDMATCL